MKIEELRKAAWKSGLFIWDFFGEEEKRERQ